MTFRQLLHSTVMLSGGSASALALLVIVHGQLTGEFAPVLISAVWWAIASIVGFTAGRDEGTNAQIARVLADARSAEQLETPRPVRTLLNRLWPLLLVSVVAGGAVFFVPPVTGVAVGFLLIWALSWRKQESAVQAVEERDGVEFRVERTGVLEPLRLVRMPGLRRDRPEHKRHAAGA
jgi:hypothetical protein